MFTRLSIAHKAARVHLVARSLRDRQIIIKQRSPNLADRLIGDVGLSVFVPVVSSNGAMSPAILLPVCSGRRDKVFAADNAFHDDTSTFNGLAEERRSSAVSPREETPCNFVAEAVFDVNVENRIEFVVQRIGVSNFVTALLNGGAVFGEVAKEKVRRRSGISEGAFAIREIPRNVAFRQIIAHNVTSKRSIVDRFAVPVVVSFVLTVGEFDLLNDNVNRSDFDAVLVLVLATLEPAFDEEL